MQIGEFMKHIDVIDVLDGKHEVGSTITVCGWVRTSRDSKNVAFLELNDGTSLKHLQVVVDKAKMSLPQEAAHLGASLKVIGEIAMNPNGNGYELEASEITVLGDCGQDYPLQKKYQKMETLRENPQLRLRTNTFNAVFRVRSVLARAIHRFFGERHYVYVHTPLITGSDAEGAGEMFKVTTIGYSTEYKSEEEYYANDFFGKRAGLSVSGQLEGEVAATALGKIYTFGPSFRAEKSNTMRHVAEFWHVEPEVAFAELPDIIEIAEEMIKYITKAVVDECPTELEFFEARFEKGLREKLDNIINNDFAIVDYTDAVNQLIASGVKFDYPVSWGCDLQTEHERYITEVIYKKPVFLCNYPKDIKAFYMKQNPDGKTVACTDLLVPGVGEIIGCSEREADYDKLVEAMKVRGMNLSAYGDYLDLRKFGSVPHSGFGLGFDRMVMYVTGMTNIRDVILYPRTVGNVR